MQNRLTLPFALTTLVLGAICVAQWRASSSRQAQLAALEEKAQQTTKRVEAQQVTIKRLEKQRSSLGRNVKELSAAVDTNGRTAGETTSKTQALANKAPVASQTATNDSESGKGGFAGMFAKMMDDPEMKKAIAEQQKLGMKMVYGDLFKQLNLTEDEKTRLMDTLVDSQMKNMENARVFLDGKETGDKSSADNPFAEQKSQEDADIKAILGEERFAQFEDYKTNLSNHMMLNQLKSELAGGKNQLQDEQAAQLLQAMREETENLSREAGFNGADQAAAPQQLDKVLSDEEMNRFFDRQMQIDQRVLQRAQNFLTPEQTAALASFQTNQMNMQKMGVKMAQSMMGGKREAAPKQIPSPSR